MLLHGCCKIVMLLCWGACSWSTCCWCQTPILDGSQQEWWFVAVFQGRLLACKPWVWKFAGALKLVPLVFLALGQPLFALVLRRPSKVSCTSWYACPQALPEWQVCGARTRTRVLYHVHGWLLSEWSFLPSLGEEAGYFGPHVQGSVLDSNRAAWEGLSCYIIFWGHR